MASGSARRTALVLYGSETGNAQDVAEELGRLCERLRFDTQVAEMNAVGLRELLRYTVVMFAIATTGQGDLPANAQTFWKGLRSVRLQPGCLKSLHFSSFGLGDSSYPKFNYAHRKLYNRLVQLGAVPLHERGESDEQHPEGIDGTFIPWSFELRARLLDQYPLPGGEEPISDDTLLDPKWILDFADDSQPPSPLVLNNTASWAENGVDSTAIPDLPPDSLLEVKDGIIAKLESNTRVTPSTHWQDVRHLKLGISEPHFYGPGDVLTIYPKNFPSDVSRLISLMNWTDVADRSLVLKPVTPNPESHHPRPPIPSLAAQRPLTLRTILTDYMDIASIPRRSFFSNIQHYTSDEMHLERLREFTDPKLIDELYNYTTRPRRSILEVLEDFSSVQIPWQRLFSVIPTMRGRQFSIASGGALKSAVAHGTSVELLVAIVKYRTVIRRVRHGVCTRYIAALKPGQRITVTLQKGGLNVKPADIHRPVVMVGPGTGIAPMRALIYERLAQRSELGIAAPEDVSGKQDLLFFGCRNRDADFFFREEWERTKADAGLQVFAAFSRDQPRKVYVQNLVREQSRAVYEALVENGGLIYVCGSSGKMPQAVREALIEAIQNEGPLTREDAESYVVRMEKENRYKQETW